MNGGEVFIKSIHIFFDTCILFAIFNPKELFHEDCTKILNYLKKDFKREKRVSGFVIDIVEEEFHQVLGHRFDEILEICSRMFDRNAKKIKIKYEAFIDRNWVAKNFLNLIFEHIFQKSPHFQDFNDFLVEITNVRTILRKKYIEFMSNKNIHFRKIDDQHIIEMLEKRIRNFKNGLKGITRSDKKILVYYDYLTYPNPYSGFLTFDGPILRHRIKCMEKLFNKYLNIINPTECLFLLYRTPEYRELVTEICLKCCKVLRDSSNNICKDCQ